MTERIVYREAHLRISPVARKLTKLTLLTIVRSTLYSPGQEWGVHARHLVWRARVGPVIFVLRFLGTSVRVNGRSYSPDKQWALPILERENKNSHARPRYTRGEG